MASVCIHVNVCVTVCICMYVFGARWPSGLSHGPWKYMGEVQIWFEVHGVLGQDTP